MAKFAPIIVVLLVLAVIGVRCRSLPAEADGALEKPTRIRRDAGQSRKPAPLRPSEDHRDREMILNEISKTVANGVLCNVPEALPGTKIPCSEGNYLVEWSPVKNGAAEINVYSVLDKVNRF